MSKMQVLLEGIRKRPSVYMSDVSVSTLYQILKGYELALADHNIEDSIFDEDLDFNDWVALRVNAIGSTAGWPNLIIEKYGADDRSLWMFFTFYDEYKNRKARIIAAVDMPQKVSSGDAQQSGNVVQAATDIPDRVELIRYTNDSGIFVRYIGQNDALIKQEEYHPNIDRALKIISKNLNLSNEDFGLF